VARILVVDDVTPNRALLATLLRHGKHEVLEAADGLEALRIVGTAHPDLVIADILMPTMDGFDFVRQLRATPAISRTEVMFYTAHYHENDARNLARACGVTRVLAKPCEPEELLRVVHQALGNQPDPAPNHLDAQPGEEFNQKHLRLLTDKLSEKAEALERVNAHFAALLELNLQIASERDPKRLLHDVCRGARELLGAQYGFLIARDNTDGEADVFMHTGLDDAAVASGVLPDLKTGGLHTVLAERDACRFVNAGGDPAAVGFPPTYPPTHCLVAAPIVSLTQHFGWICLVNKLGATKFSGEHQRVLGILAAQVGRSYESSSLHVQVQRNTERLILEMAERERAAEQVLHLNRVHSVLSGINAVIVRVADRDELFSEACRIAVEQGHFALAWVGWLDPVTSQVSTVAWAGDNLGLTADHSVGLESTGGTIVALAMRSCKPQVRNHLQAADATVFSAERLVARGYKGIVALPLVVEGKSVGCLVLVTTENDFFNAAEMHLLMEMAGDVSYALNHLRKAEQLDHLAYYDSLTGLANRSLFHERMAQHVTIATHGGTGFALVIVDPERFDAINDNYGRQAGDQLLKELGERLVRSVGSAQQVARLGADQFAALIPNVHAPDDVARTLEVWWRDWLGEPFQVEGTEVRLTAKGGIALFPTDGADADTLLKHAESALRSAKNSAEPHHFYTRQLSQRIAERLAFESKLRQALAKGEYVLHYQPKVDVDTRRLEGVEALLRWQHPEMGLVPPLKFISILEETGMIVDVGAWVLRQATLDRARWLELGLQAPRVAVNVSTVQLHRQDFVATVTEVLRLTGRSDAGIDIEVTESLIMEDFETTVQKLRAIRALGVGIAIDDFGTGYSSLAYLARLPVHTLKIDRSFTSTMLDAPDTMTLIATVVSLAHSLKLTVIAEGVELEEQAKILRLIRCDQMQGYLISKPVPFDELTTRLTPSKQAEV
jgi:diguanylate cyclase (GGDEF)-like protein